MGVDDESRRMSGSNGRDEGRLEMVRVLGPVDAVVDGRVVRFGSRMERILLAALAVSANHAVSSDQLADVLWGDDVPASADNTLQSYVSRLRHLLGRRVIASQDHSYSLEIDPDRIDAVRVERLAAEAVVHRFEPDACLERCRSALALWRGTPFGELADEAPFHLEAIRLEEIRSFVVELRLACDIVLGREELALGSLKAAVEEAPERERLWHLLIAALALSGRRTEAVRAYDSLCELLASSGLDPLAETRALARAVADESADIRAGLLDAMAGNR